jgi:hypothetical protein
MRPAGAVTGWVRRQLLLEARPFRRVPRLELTADIAQPYGVVLWLGGGRDNTGWRRRSIG